MKTVQSKDLPKYNPPLGENDTLAAATMPEYCAKCSCLEVRPHYNENRWPPKRYENGDGILTVEGEHIVCTCTRCHYQWPRRCHDMEGMQA